MQKGGRLWKVPDDVRTLLAECREYSIAQSEDDLLEISCNGTRDGFFEVAYDVPGKGRVVEATVCRVKNGIAANYPEPYMRRRDPDCLVIGDSLATDKPRFSERFGRPFDEVRAETFAWLKNQPLVVFPFKVGQSMTHMGGMAIAPANAGFFALALGLLQGILPPEDVPENFSADAVIFVAPPFRHTHFDGKQVVVHNRLEDRHELFSYNLYPGPSAKKGVYGVLINLGEKESWVTAHCSTVQVVTPYNNKVTIMHEGASGGGKSEMLEHAHREADGRLLMAQNVVTGEQRHLTLPRGCDLRPVTDDMALCHPSVQRGDGHLTVLDAEAAWFLRVNHITRYGSDPNLESVTVSPPRPLLFLNIKAVPGATTLIWEHIEDAPGKLCPNPRVVVPRSAIPNVVNKAVTVDIRSFGVRTPPCTRRDPSYGIIGLMHVLPPALAWLWRLVAPRGYDNPSILDSDHLGSEGVGSYWPFATGRKVDQANLLLQQIIDTPLVKYILCPNQHVGAWAVGFMPQWISREYLARRGGSWFAHDEVCVSRSALLGYALKEMVVEGRNISSWFLQSNLQPEIGDEGYDAGAAILESFFHQQIRGFLSRDLNSLGARIIECCLDGGSVQDYTDLVPHEVLAVAD